MMSAGEGVYVQSMPYLVDAEVITVPVEATSVVVGVREVRWVVGPRGRDLYLPTRRVHEVERVGRVPSASVIRRLKYVVATSVGDAI